jgi:asparagine synthase (glutamine-hydrolysing)
MGGLFITTNSNPQRRNELADLARPHFGNAGLTNPSRIDTGTILIDLYPKYRRLRPTVLQLDNYDFVIAVGTFLFQGRTGVEALRSYITQPNPPQDRCRGAYLLLINRNGRVELRADPHGTYELYIDDSRTLFSTSFLALAACLPRRSIRRAECLEYIVGGVTLGTGTPIAEIDRLDLGETIDFADTSRHHITRPSLIEPERPAPIGDLIERSLASLRTTMRDYASAFDNRIRISFSGGYDSRLLLALARDCGVDPHLFVYGSKTSPDVLHAAALARTEGVSFEHIDKSQIRPVTIEAFPEMLRASYEINDGFSQYWMFCSDSENYARIDRCAGDGVVMNGGGGEVFRNFFKFRGQSMSVKNFVRAFFSSYDPAILVDRDLQADYETNLIRKITTLFGLHIPHLTGAHVQSLYPHLRCRSWFGRDTSIDARFGHRATPYLEPLIVNTALQIPLGWKHFGVFQGRLINTLAPKIAAHMSSHGYTFDRDPSWRNRLSDLRLLTQPIPTRVYNSRLKHFFANTKNIPKELSDEYLRNTIDLQFPGANYFLNQNLIKDASQLQRFYVLQYMFKKIL